jgi:hypothetical protein
MGCTRRDARRPGAQAVTLSPDAAEVVVAAVTAGQLHVRRLQPSEALEGRAWIAERHYLESAPPGFVHVYEFTLGGERRGGLILGRTSARQYDPERILEVTRLFFVDDTPPHVESRALALARKHVRIWIPKIRLLIAYSDPDQGHEGIIYEADNWCPFGMTDGAWGYGWKSREGRRGDRVSKKQRWVRTP